MRILQLTNKNPHPARDGGAIATLALARGLAKAGNDVTVLAMETSKHRSETSQIPPEPFSVLQVPVDTRISIFRAATNLAFSRLPYNAVRFNHSGFKSKLDELLSTQTYDVIILENLYTLFYLDLIRSKSTALVVMRAHNLEFEIWERNAMLSSGFKRWYLKNLAKRIKRYELQQVNRYDILTPITQRDAEQFQKLGNSKPVYVLNTGINNKNIIDQPKPINEPTVAHIGALDWIPNQKGLSWFMKAVWPLLIEKEPKVEFHLAGRNAPDDFVARMIQMGVHFHGEVDNATEFIDNHSIMIVPLFSGSGMRIKLIEYMARGKTVVSTPIGAEGLPITNSQHLLIEEDPKEMAAAIVSLIHDPKRCNDLGKQAILFVRNHFENDHLVQQFSDFLSKRVNLPS